MEAEIRAAIEKSLPSAVGDVLKKRLEQAEQLAAKLESTQAHNQTLAKKVSELEATIKSDEERTGQIKKLQESIALAKTTTDDKRIVDMIEKHANEKVDLVKSLFTTVFANAKLKSTVLENSQVSQVVPGTGGGYYTTTTPVTSTKTTETEVG
jgi:predicted RNase H-like nuclease (RuvC/YqgF family)